VLLLVGVLVSACDIRWVRATEVIYIKSDGSIDPPDAPISTVDNITYTFTGNIYNRIVILRNNIIVNGNGKTLQGSFSGYGFYWSGINNVTIKNANIRSFEVGIFTYGSSHNTFSGNNITDSADYGICLVSSSSNTIYGNSITYSTYIGIYLDSSSNNNYVYGNEISNNDWYGVDIRDSCLNNVSDNSIVYSTYVGIWLYGSCNSNIVSGNNIAYITWVGADIGGSHNTFSENDITTVKRGVCVSGSNNTVSKNTITDTQIGVDAQQYSHNHVSLNNITNSLEQGIVLYSSCFNIISGNIITNNKVGLAVLDMSHNNIIFGNTIENSSSKGVWFGGSNNNTVYGNIITKSGYGFSSGYGISLEGCYSNEFKYNRMTDNRYNFYVGGSELTHFIHDIDSSNTVNGKKIYYLVDRHGMEIPSDAGFVALVSSTNIIVKQLELENNSQGILLVYTRNSQIANNSISNNERGIYFWDSSFNTVFQNNIANNTYSGVYIDKLSSNNTVSGNSITNNGRGFYIKETSSNVVSGNNITNNYYGFSLSNCSNNRIYHNNIINNTQQVSTQNSVNIWHNGYPSGGNYWSDYTGKDEKCGVDQNITGSDGIGDTPRFIDTDNTDRYPLMTPSVIIYGRVIVEGTNAVAPPTVHNVRGLRVDLIRGSDVLETVYSDVNGDFVCSNVGGPSDVRLMLTLEDRDNTIKTYDNTRDANNPSWLRTPTFRVERPYRANIAMNIAIDNSITYELNGVLFVPMMPDDTNVGEDRFAHLAVIYHNTYLAARFAVENLGLTLDHALPVEVRAFATGGTLYTIATSTIWVDQVDSSYSSTNRPDNREWHEFGHHIMTDSSIGGDNLMPTYSGVWWFLADLDDNGIYETNCSATHEVNHWGYINPTTTDSWTEGFAEFMSLMVAVIVNEPSPWIYNWAGGATNLEDPVLTWRDEEFAVAAILWDLYDANVDSYNMSATFGWQQYNGRHLILDDRISLSLEEIWSRLESVAPTNLTGVYDTFAYLNSNDSDSDGIHDLDEIFILHGAFADSPPMGQYNGEAIGRAAYTTPQVATRQIQVIGGTWFPTGASHRIRVSAVPSRTAKPPYPGSFINVTVIDNATGLKLDNAELFTQMIYDEPYASHNYNYTVSLRDLPKNVSITLPILPSKAYIYAQKIGYDLSDPLILNSTFYWDSLSQPKDILLNHTFYLQPSHDIAVTNITTHKTVVGQNYPLRVNVTIENQGLFFNETFNVTVYANTTIIETKEVTLTNGNSTTVTFTWNTSGVAKGNYTITAEATQLPYETDKLDNTLTDGWIIVAMVGDLTGPEGVPDGKCDMRDVYVVARAFGSHPGHPLWNPNADITGPQGLPDEKVDMRDIYVVARNFGKTDP